MLATAKHAHSFRPICAAVTLACASAGLWAVPASAAEAMTGNGQAASVEDANPAELPEADLKIQARPLDVWTGFWTRQNLLGDLGGLRTTLGRHGVTLGLSETSEILRNTSGGLKQGSAYDGLTTLTLGVDTQKAFGLAGGTFNVSALNIHGRNLSQFNLGNLQTASGIEADPGTRLWELWYQQKFLGNQSDIKLGQQSIDQEFMVSQYAGTFMNTMFGWPTVPSYDMPGGGPAYPLSGLGVRLRAKPSDTLTVLAGVFDGDPAAKNGDDNFPNGDPQLQNAHGTNFNLRNGKLYIAELQFGRNQPGLGQLEAAPSGKGLTSGALPGTYKLGVWYNTERFNDLRDVDGDGNAILHDGNYSVYAVADQMVWRPSEDSSRTLNVFTRLMGAPGDRNLVSISANAGVTLTAPFIGRDSDTAGLAFGYARIGSHARSAAQDSVAASGANTPVRGSETFVETTYQYQLTPWWQLQGDLQYTFNPVNPGDLTQRLGGTFVVGLRTNITF